jgi:hypothetical protein
MLAASAKAFCLLRGGGMKIFVWHRVKNCTTNYHTEGGVVVIAGTEERAREVAGRADCVIAEAEKPDYVADLLHGESDGEKLFLMPDAGCC